MRSSLLSRRVDLLPCRDSFKNTIARHQRSTSAYPSLDMVVGRQLVLLAQHMPCNAIEAMLPCVMRWHTRPTMSLNSGSDYDHVRFTTHSTLLYRHQLPHTVFEALPISSSYPSTRSHTGHAISQSLLASGPLYFVQLGPMSRVLFYFCHQHLSSTFVINICHQHL